jgi:hypothetical protein
MADNEQLALKGTGESLAGIDEAAVAETWAAML